MTQLDKKSLIEKKMELEGLIREYQKAIDAIDIVLQLVQNPTCSNPLLIGENQLI